MAKSTPITWLERHARSVLRAGCDRRREYAVALPWLAQADTVLDVACGTGTFMEARGANTIGIDVNPTNVDYCTGRGLTAVVGDALELPFGDGTFDGVHCSHLLQVFDSGQAVRLIRELARVTRPRGRIVLTTLNDFRRFYRHPENARPYPPDAVRRLFGKQEGSQSPMFSEMPALAERSIWLRRPALLELNFPSSAKLGAVGAVLAAAQRQLGLRKFWQFDAYTMCFERL